jgi:hypothetical protein
LHWIGLWALPVFYILPIRLDYLASFELVRSTILLLNVFIFVTMRSLIRIIASTLVATVENALVLPKQILHLVSQNKLVAKFDLFKVHIHGKPKVQFVELIVIINIVLILELMV